MFIYRSDCTHEEEGDSFIWFDECAEVPSSSFGSLVTSPVAVLGGAAVAECGPGVRGPAGPSSKTATHAAPAGIQRSTGSAPLHHEPAKEAPRIDLKPLLSERVDISRQLGIVKGM